MPGASARGNSSSDRAGELRGVLRRDNASGRAGELRGVVRRDDIDRELIYSNDEDSKRGEFIR